MEFVFKQTASFGAGKQYKLGHHDVPDDVLKHPYFIKLKKAGLVVQAKAGESAKPAPSILEGQKAAIEKQKAHAVKVAKAEEPAPKKKKE